VIKKDGAGPISSLIGSPVSGIFFSLCSQKSPIHERSTNVACFSANFLTQFLDLLLVVFRFYKVIKNL